MSEKIKVYMNVAVAREVAVEIEQSIKENGGEVISIEPATRFDIYPTHPDSAFNRFAEKNKLYSNIIFAMESDKDSAVDILNTTLSYSF